MGAGNSTAASCSSLDLANDRAVNKYRYYQRQQNRQQYLQEHKLSRYRKQQPNAPQPANYLRQASSHLDLSSSHLLREDEDESLCMRKGDELHYGFSRPSAEAYNLTNADVSCPVMVLPAKSRHQHVSPVINLASVAKKSNAGVASRILQHRQQQRSAELRKFSDSMPSLNNILCQQPAFGVQMKPPLKECSHIQHRQKPTFHRTNPPLPPPPHHRPVRDYQETCAPVLVKQQQVLRARDQASAMHQRQAKHQSAASKQKVSNAILVTPSNPCYNHRGQAQSIIIDENDRTVMSPRVFDRQNRKQRQMKRATSLSSLHNLNQSSQQCKVRNFYADQMDVIVPTPFSQSIHLEGPSNINFQRCHINDNQLSDRMPSSSARERCEYDRERRHSPSHRVAAHEVRGSPYKPPPKTPQHRSYAQLHAMPPKTGYKYKQSANVAGNPARNNRYKSRLQQQQAAQQQGCPVLPQLPRSQSLHELIQLRATENGQRMRTTGTLRGPVSGSENVGKVNLVAELLETRRQQRREDDKVLAPNEKSETLLSQSSSSDDGIHDVSIGGDGQNSTGDSRGKQFSTSSSKNHSSISSRDGDEKVSGPARQRIFKKQPANSSNSNRFLQKNAPEQAKLDAREHQVEGQTNQEKQQNQMHKSTLKRSTSYSALQNSSRDKTCDEGDGDESDDLNELAKFLYQFKQRQAKIASAAREDNSKSKSDLAQDVIQTDRQISARKVEPVILQQSPNSTTSSSGFASSTCTSQSTSLASGGSAGSNKKRGTFEASPPAVSQDISKKAPLSRLSSPKKYPAPPRPDQEIRVKADSAESGGTKHCLISSKLKLSSSLLSIVDEYQSTLENNGRLLTKNLHATSSSNLTSVHLYNAQSNNQASLAELELQAGGIGVSPRSRQPNVDQKQQDDEQQAHFEHLRRYTKQRQMSQSELALNHLNSSKILDISGNGLKKSKDQQRRVMQTKTGSKNNHDNGAGEHKGNAKPYSNRLFGLIRRISDKSDLPNKRAGCAGGVASGNSSQGYGRGPADKRGSGHVGGNAVGGQLFRQVADESCSDAINQVATKHGRQASRKCDGQESPAQGRLDDENRSGASGGGSSHSHERAVNVECERAGESLCDLEFDCDFELIKNCRSANELLDPARDSTKTSCSRRDAITPTTSASRKPSSLFTNATSSTVCNDESKERRVEGKKKSLAGAEKKRKQNGASGLAINNPSRENNWRLAPSSSLACLANSCANISDTCNQEPRLRGNSSNNDGHHEANNYNNKEQKKDASLDDAFGGLARCSLGVKDRTPACNSQHLRQQSKQQSKSKWSASSWWLGSGSSEKKKDSAGPKKLRISAEAEENNGNKSYLARLIQSSGAPTSGSGAKSKQRLGDKGDERRSDMISEADKLLVELDHSLDLVSGQSFEPKPWWQGDCGEMNGVREAALTMMSEGVCINRTRSDHSNADISDDEDDNDDADYASINRALINETFDFDPEKFGNSNGVAITPGSPSDSFTFSAPSSPAPTFNLATRAETCLEPTFASHLDKLESRECCLPLDVCRAPSKQSGNAATSEHDAGESKLTCRTPSDHSNSLDPKRRLGVAANLKGGSSPGDATACDAKSCAVKVGQKICNAGSKLEHRTDALEKACRNGFRKESTSVSLPNSAEVSSSRPQQNDELIHAEESAKKLSKSTNTYKKVRPDIPQASSNQSQLDACTTSNACKLTGSDRAAKMVRGGIDGIAQKSACCMQSDACHQHYRDNPFPRPLAAKQIGINGVHAALTSSSTDRSGENKRDHNRRINHSANERAKEEIGGTSEKFSDCSLGCLDTGVKCVSYKGGDGVKLREKTAEAVDPSAFAIHGQSMPCSAQCCGCKSSAKEGNCVNSNSGLEQLAQESPRKQHHTCDSEGYTSAKESCRIELSRTGEEQCSAACQFIIDEQEVGTQACNCEGTVSLATAETNVNISAQKSELPPAVDEEGQRNNGRAFCKNCPPVDSRTKVFHDCLSCKNGFRCDQSHSAGDDKLIIQENSCRCCSRCAPPDNVRCSSGDCRREFALAKPSNIERDRVKCGSPLERSAGNKVLRPALISGSLCRGEIIPEIGSSTPGSGKVPSGVSYYHYPHKTEPASTMADGVHHYRPIQSASEKRENALAGARGSGNLLRNFNNLCPPPTKNRMESVCGTLAGCDASSSKPNANSCSKSSPSKMNGRSSPVDYDCASHSDDKGFNEDAENMCCPYNGMQKAITTCAHTEDEMNVKSGVSRPSLISSSRARMEIACCEPACGNDKFARPTESATADCDCTDKLESSQVDRSHICDIVNRKMTPGSNQMAQAKSKFPLSDVSPSSQLTGSNGSRPEKRLNGNALFGKLRSSLTNQRVVEPSKGNRSNLVHVAQENYYDLGKNSAFQGILLPVDSQFGPKSSHKLSAAKNVYDENFILKRKTPTAGLKSGC